MKRSLLDPLPRQLSTKALAALVALVVCGTGVAVVRFLESSHQTVHGAPADVRAGSPSCEEDRPVRVRASTRGAAESNSSYSSGTSEAWFDASRCTSSGDSAPASAAHDREATLARPPVQGS